MIILLIGMIERKAAESRIVVIRKKKANLNMAVDWMRK